MNIHTKRGKLKISTKVALSFFIIVLFQGLLTQIGMYLLIYQSNIHSFQSQMAVTIEGVDAFLLQRRDDLDNKVNLLSGQKNVIEYTDFRLRNLLRRELTLFNQALGLNGVFIFVDSGKLIAADETSPPSIEEKLSEKIRLAFRQGRQSFLYENGTGMYLWSLGQIVRDNEVIGMIGARISLDSGFVDILEKNTNALAIINFPGRIIHSGSLSEDLMSGLLETSSAMSPGEIRISGNHLLGVTGLQGFGSASGSLVCALNIRELKQSIRDYNRFAVILTLIVLAVAMGLSILFYRKSFLRPYNALQEGVQRIGDGDFTYPIKQTSGDEFGDLVESVNRMRINLLNRDRELTALSNYNELILNNVRSGIITVGHDGRINACNAAASSMVHMDGKRGLPLDLDKAVLPVEVKELIRRGLSGAEYVTLRECRLEFEGREEILTVSTSPFSDGSGEELGVIAVIADVTQMKKLEEQLQVSQRLAAIGEMVAGVAHQIRNPLAVMKVSAEILRDNGGKKTIDNMQEYRDLTGMLVNEIDSVNYIIHNFLDFARPLHISRSVCSVRDIFDTALSHLPLGSFPDATLTVLIDPDLPPQMLDKELMEQVVRNLVQNAVEASPRGKVIVEALGGEGNLKIIVSDTGCGMDTDTKRNIFNPFFTLKNKGTGLGLSIVHRIIQEHSGTITVETAPGKGSTFTVLLQNSGG